MNPYHFYCPLQTPPLFIHPHNRGADPRARWMVAGLPAISGERSRVKGLVLARPARRDKVLDEVSAVNGKVRGRAVLERNTLQSHLLSENGKLSRTA